VQAAISAVQAETGWDAESCEAVLYGYLVRNRDDMIRRLAVSPQCNKHWLSAVTGIARTTIDRVLKAESAALMHASSSWRR
jgi:hypothetical protein